MSGPPRMQEVGYECAKALSVMAIVWVVLTVLGVLGVVVVGRGLLRASPTIEFSGGWWSLVWIASIAVTGVGLWRLFST